MTSWRKLSHSLGYGNCANASSCPHRARMEPPVAPPLSSWDSGKRSGLSCGAPTSGSLWAGPPRPDWYPGPGTLGLPLPAPSPRREAQGGAALRRLEGGGADVGGAVGRRAGGLQHSPPSQPVAPRGGPVRSARSERGGYNCPALSYLGGASGINPRTAAERWDPQGDDSNPLR